MDLFTQQRQKNRQRATPLAARLRPHSLDDFVGQQHFLGPGKLLRRMLASDRLSSAVFYGPAGTGKTTLAHVIAHLTSAHFESVHAAVIGVKDVRRVLAEARSRLEVEGRRTILFVDELHRFNRAQQDVLLDDVESGVVILLGATTENPFFTINTPLLSRSQVFQFEPLSETDILTLLHRALSDKENGFGALDINLTQEAAQHLSTMADGDARRALTALEVAVLSQLDKVADRKPAAAGARAITIDLATAADSIQRKAQSYDRQGDQHYDTASALIKSIRGSDPDAAVYWLARMIESGEDPRFIARRVVIAAAEDIGNADPQALVVAQAAADATAFIGLPECQLPLAQAVIYLSCAPKSNASAKAIWQALDEVRNGRTIPVPRSLRDAHYRGARQLGHGAGYEYPHDSAEGRSSQDYLGVDRIYYEPTDRGAEADWSARLEQYRRQRELPPHSGDHA